MAVTLPTDYRPSSDEPFMNEKQREYFRQKLQSWRDELLRDTNNTRDEMENGDRPGSDFADQAASETDRSLELRTRGRERRLIAKIDEALDRIQAGTYGYCADTGKPIGLARLEARPIAALSIEAQERHEEMESRGYRG
jgi:RNA polymerase-binding transcription factor